MGTCVLAPAGTATGAGWPELIGMAAGAVAGVADGDPAVTGPPLHA
jgi:hypothetical protein